jgi:PIN domain
VILLYLETNFLIGHAKYQDDASKLQEIVRETVETLQIVIPSSCFMEALSVLEDERGRNEKFRHKTEDLTREVKSIEHSEEARKVSSDLNRVLLESAKIFENIQERLDEILKWTLNSATVIPFDTDVAMKSLNKIYIEDPTDNLILHTILSHAHASQGEKVFLSGNHRDFGQKTVKEQLSNEGIDKYVTKLDEFLGWFNSQR